jgi:hypothetical protein
MPLKNSPHLAHSNRNATHSSVVCQICSCAAREEDAIVLRQEGRLVFAVCHACTQRHDIVMRPMRSGTSGGVKVSAKRDARIQTPAPRRARRIPTPFPRVA